MSPFCQRQQPSGSSKSRSGWADAAGVVGTSLPRAGTRFFSSSPSSAGETASHLNSENGVRGDCERASRFRPSLSSSGSLIIRLAQASGWHSSGTASAPVMMEDTRMLIAVWNLNHRTGKMPFFIEAVDAIAALQADVVVLTEYY